MLEGKMVKHCIYENGSATFEMSEEGFYGECGIVDFHYNPEKRCYEFTTYGENINGSQVAAEIQKLINNAPPNLSLVIQILLVVALIIQFLAILFGFKKLP
ncbi:MAG: hypothetical protein KAU24_01435 [Candidatus Aenigmarchaeota archaeon]|nr:hypothetical protein [Candidatus Aenigmarchaeota archaeon]